MKYTVIIMDPSGITTNHVTANSLEQAEANAMDTLFRRSYGDNYKSMNEELRIIWAKSYTRIAIYKGHLINLVQ